MTYCHFILVLWALINVSIIQIYSSYFPEEMRALLDFKASINETRHPDLILPSWIGDYHDHEEQGYDNDDPIATDCCNWEGVKCSDATGRIVELHLSHLGRNIVRSYFPPQWFLNLSMLLPLENLQALDLSHNYFRSSGLAPCERLGDFKIFEFVNLNENKLDSTTFQCLSTISSLKHLSLANNRINFLEGCERLGSFKNLKFLNLDWNNLDNRTIQCMTTISSLKNLSLVGNYMEMEGLFPLKEISRLKQLEYLDLSDNFFHGSLSFKDLKLPHLELLNLGSTGMQELSSIEVMTSLKALSLRYNNITDSSILEGICSLKNLLQLDLSGNNFSGNIPLCLSTLTSLQFLDISGNNFSGNIPSLVITSLVHLEFLSLSSNHFEGSFSLTSIANHSKLQQFMLEPLGGKLYVKTEGLNFLPSFQFRVLRLVGCNLNNETRKVPEFLLYQKELRVLDLSSNNLVGKFPNWLLENNTLLEVLNLWNNSFTGPFLSDATPKLQHLWMLDIANNEVGGQVPEDIGLFFPRLQHLNLVGNSFEGSIPESLGNLTSASFFDLSRNNFSGEVPDRIGIGCVNLFTLVLSYNSLQGYFPTSSTNLTILHILLMDNNHFSGSISHGLSRSSSLHCLDISNNEFQGDIPRWIGNFSSLYFLDLSRNQLEGTIPDDICKLSHLQFLGLSENRLNGSIPSCSGFPLLKFIHLQMNQITGSIPIALLENSTSLRALDLRYNRISGGFPHDIKTPTQLRVLLLGGNNLHDRIPTSICQLKELSIMDLSQNNFSGPIPSCISYISFGANFNYDSWNLISWHPTSWGQDTFNSPRSKTYQIVQFTTKDITYSYTGNTINFMSGIDLSHNQLTGEIPPELGDLSDIRALNLSHNYLEGTTPSQLSMLKNIESLDLSYNNLSGQIPSELTNLNFLSKFNVSYNNLSGRTPDKGQFANFDESNYRGNLGLCGPLLQRQCESITGTVNLVHGVGGEDNDGADYTIEFFTSFSVSFLAVLVTLALSLYLNPHYRRAWSNYIDTWILFRFYLRYKSHYK